MYKIYTKWYMNYKRCCSGLPGVWLEPQQGGAGAGQELRHQGGGRPGAHLRQVMIIMMIVMMMIMMIMSSQPSCSQGTGPSSHHRHPHWHRLQVIIKEIISNSLQDYPLLLSLGLVIKLNQFPFLIRFDIESGPATVPDGVHVNIVSHRWGHAEVTRHEK